MEFNLTLALFVVRVTPISMQCRTGCKLLERSHSCVVLISPVFNFPLMKRSTSFLLFFFPLQRTKGTTNVVRSLISFLLQECILSEYGVHHYLLTTTADLIRVNSSLIMASHCLWLCSSDG